jgi:peptide/nickel transport system ATP-binding protein
MADVLLEIENLTVGFDGETGRREILRDVSFTLLAGEILGIVGESGSGKSVTALAIMRLLGAQGAITHGAIRLAGSGDLARLSPDEMRAVRGRRIGMIFQEPMSSLNPLMSVGRQVGEVLEAHLGMDRRTARAEVIALLARVGIPNPELRIDEYPHAMSGGMRQRVMIAMAMALKPSLLMADEPTTALDVTIQAQILALMKQLRQEHGTAILLITHDMGVIARMADRVAVMYAGEVVEVGVLRDIFASPAHPYTRLLLAAMPTVSRRSARLPVIPGLMPSPGAMPQGCRFHPRCPDAHAPCRERVPPVVALGEGRMARCWLAQAAAGDVPMHQPGPAAETAGATP